MASLSALAVVALAGCPGELQNAEEFESMPACRGNIDVPQLIQDRCGSAVCHGSPESSQGGGLHLTGDNVAELMVGVPAHGCDGLLRVDPDNPDQSFFLGKLLGPPAGCGDRMPLVGFLNQTEVSCVRAWMIGLIDEVDAERDGGVSTPEDAGTSTTEDAGTDTTDAGPDTMDAGPDTTDAGPELDAGNL